MNKGSLTYDDYFKLIKNDNIIYKEYKLSQIQPSSIDLTLSDECYEIKASFLSPYCTIRDKLDEIIAALIIDSNIMGGCFFVGLFRLWSIHHLKQ